MRGLSQTFGARSNATIRFTAIGKSRLAGNAARNCATGCTFDAIRGRKPTTTPIGTHTTVARMIRITTRARVNKPLLVATVTSFHVSTGRANCTSFAVAYAIRPATVPYHAISANAREGIKGSSQAGLCGTASRARATVCAPLAIGAVTYLIAVACRNRSSTQLRGTTWAAVCSKRNLSAHATSGRKKS